MGIVTYHQKILQSFYLIFFWLKHVRLEIIAKPEFPSEYTLKICVREAPLSLVADYMLKICEAHFSRIFR